MSAKREFLILADKFSQMLGTGTVTDIRIKPMASYEQGFSGAQLLRIECMLSDGKQQSYICKKTGLKERMVMRTLTGQGHSCTPAAYSEDCVSNEPRWMIQQDLGKRVAAPGHDQQWMAKVANALAEIHGNNMARSGEMPWLPHTDQEYWHRIVTEISVAHFEKAVCDDDQFARQFEPYLLKVHNAGKQFARDMTSLQGEAEWLTLTHGDLQNIDGDHVYNVQGDPYLIDFGFAGYAPLYIDLVDYFSPENAFLYHQALAARGFRIHRQAFEERFRAVYKYPGFIYMFPAIMQWRRGSDERLTRLINRILNS